MKKLLNQRGMSLVEVLVAAGMLGVVSLGVGHIMGNLGKTMRWSESKNEEIALINRFNYELRDQLVCTHTFVGYCEDQAGAIGRYTTQRACEQAHANLLKVNPATTDSYTWVPRVTPTGEFDQVFSRTNTVIFAKGNTYGNASGQIEIKSMTFTPDPPSSTPVAGQQTNAIVRLVIQRNDRTASIASREIANDVNMTVKWSSANTIEECFADREDTILTAKIQSCEAVGGNFNITLDWCELHEGPDSGTPGVREDGIAQYHSRAVEQSYVDDLFRRSCTGPGKIYVPGDGAGTPPTCDVDTTRLATFCTVGQYLYSVSFGDTGPVDVGPGGTKFDTNGDGDTLRYVCQNYCSTDPSHPYYGIFMGINGDGSPNCKRCNPGQILVADGNREWQCKDPRGNCTNVDDTVKNEIVIQTFDGWGPNGEAVCREVARHPKNACPSGEEMIGFRTILEDSSVAGNPPNSKIVPQCCKRRVLANGNPCPYAGDVCANGYLAPIDQCGFACPGTKPQSVNNDAQPLVYGCEYYTDTQKITRYFPEWTCGTPADPSTAQSTTISTRPCYLGANKANQTYETCQNTPGARVAFFSKVENNLGPGASVLSSGKEEDSYCLLPQTYDTTTFGRESTAMVNSCVNCNFTSINITNVRNARKCPSPWKDAINAYGQIIYQVASTYCRSYSLANVGTSCGSYGEARSYTIPADAFLESAYSDRAYWPGSYLPDGGYSPVSGASQSDHGQLPDVNTYPTAHYDAWDKDHTNCPDNTIGQTHWESYLCYARISGISCK